MMCVQCAGVVPFAATGQTIQAWLRWTLLVCVLVISGIFGGATEARAVTPGVQVISACAPNGPNSLTCDDQTPFAVRWTDTTNPDHNGNQPIQSCYRVYSEGGNLLEEVGFPCGGATDSSNQSSTFPPFQVGIHHITVNRGYIGGDSPASSCCQTVEVVVTRAPRATFTTVASGANPSSVHSATFYAKVVDLDPTKYPFSGTVTYNVDGQGYCTTNVAPDGTAGACLADTLSTGSHGITATFNGDPTHLAGRSAGITQVVAPPPASIAATAGTPQQTPVGTAFGATLQVQVKDASGQPVPNQTISFSGPASGPTAFLNTISPVTDSNGYAAVTATASGVPGSYVLTASVAGVEQLASFALTNQLGTNIISFAKPADTSFTATPPVPGATASSKLAVTYTSSTSPVCTVTSAGMISFFAAGACTILADQAGNGNYAAATQVQQTFNVIAGSNVISFVKPADTSFTATPPVPGATASSKLAVTYTSSPAAVCTVTSAGVISFVAAGACTILADQAGNGNYAPAQQVAQTFNATVGGNIISFAKPADTSFTATPPVPGATASSKLAVTYKSSTTPVCTVTSAGVISFVAAGTCSIDATQAGNGNYSPAVKVTQVFNVTAGANLITFAGLPDALFAAGPLTLTANASSGLAVSFTSATPAVCTISGKVLAFVIAGTCTATASQPGNGNYAAANPVTQSFKIIAAKPVATAFTVNVPYLSPGRGIDLSAHVSGLVTSIAIAARTAHGTANLSGSLATYVPARGFSGADSFAFTATGPGGTSDPAIVTLQVAARPDPSLDADVKSGIDAQVQTTQRFGQTQIDNVNRRLEDLHADNVEPLSFGISLSSGEQVPLAYGRIEEPKRNLSPDNSNVGITALRKFEPAFSEKPQSDVKRNDNPFAIWTGGAVLFGKTNSAGQADRSFTTSGLTAGIDTRFGTDVKAGIAFGFGADRTDIGTGGSRNNFSSTSATLYDSWRVLPQTFIDAQAGYGSGSFGTRRIVSADGSMVTGSRNASNIFGSLTLTSEQKWAVLKFAPYVRLDAMRIALDSYSEQGSDIWALSYGRLNATSLSGVLGLRGSYPILLDWGTLTPMARLEYRRNFAWSYQQILGYADLPGTLPYSIAGAAQSRDQFSAAFGLKAAQSELLSLHLEYQLGGTTQQLQSQSVRAGVKLGF